MNFDQLTPQQRERVLKILLDSAEIYYWLHVEARRRGFERFPQKPSLTTRLKRFLFWRRFSRLPD